MAKLLLVHPLFLVENAQERASSSPYFPLGILYLAGFVREAGHEVAVFDGTFEPSRSAFDEALRREQPDIVGVSCVLPSRDAAVDLAERAHRAGAVVVAGGPDATADPAAYLAAEAVDLVVHHEGEQTTVGLLDRCDASTLAIERLSDEPGIAFRRDGQIIVNEPRPPIENLDTLPLPARDLIDMDRYLDTWDEASGYRSMTISTSRGCPFQCEWCVDAVHGSAYRQRSPESVAAEMRILKDTYDIGRLRVIDDVDGIERSWLERWAEQVEAVGAVIPFEALNDLERQDIPLLDVRDSL